MNRIQFWILTGLSGTVGLLLIAQVVLVQKVSYEQQQLAAAQQVLNQGQTFQNNLKQLAIRILSDSQKTQDPALKDLLARQKITYTPNPADSTNSTETPAPTTPPAAH